MMFDADDHLFEMVDIMKWLESGCIPDDEASILMLGSILDNLFRSGRSKICVALITEILKFEHNIHPIVLVSLLMQSGRGGSELRAVRLVLKEKLKAPLIGVVGEQRATSILRTINRFLHVTLGCTVTYVFFIAVDR